MEKKRIKGLLETKTTLEFDKFVVLNDIDFDEWTPEIHEHLKSMRDESIKSISIEKPIHVLRNTY